MTKKDVQQVIQSMTADELAELSAQVQARQTAVREQLEHTELGAIAAAANQAAKNLGWTKLPRLMLTANEDGTAYTVEVGKAKSNGTRTQSEPTNGGITLKKIGAAHGGIASLKDKDGHEYKTVKDLIKVLVQPDGKPESDRCFGLAPDGKGIAPSDIITKHHADEVALVFKDGTTKLVKDAVAEAKAARAVA